MKSINESAIVNATNVDLLSAKSETNRPLSFNTNKLFYGDNLEILRRHIPNECIDMIYLDPPFKSDAHYNILFKEADGEPSAAQIQAFSDTWHWDTMARQAYEYLTSNAVDNKVANVAEAFYRMLGKNDMTAYLFIMAERLIELHRVLKPTGTLFLHCDPTASHYLKILLDSIFGAKNFINEIIWKRSFAHSDTKQGSQHFGRLHDTILFYAKSEKYTWNQQYDPYDQDYINEYYQIGEDGRAYQLTPIDGPGGGSKGNPRYEFLGVTRYWRYSKETMTKLYKAGRIVQTKPGNVPRYKQYLDEMPGVPYQDIWTNIRPLSSKTKERLGYPTQKPEALLERILKSCSNEGDWVLDPFCGCGTAIAAAEKLGRRWIGIDVTWLAINLVKGRLNSGFQKSHHKLRFGIEGEPKDVGAAKALAENRYQFQWWALSLIGARPVGSTPSKPREGKKGADEGIDGWLRFRDGEKLESIVVQVKSGHVGVKDIRELEAVVARQNAAMGIFITLAEPTSEMIKEIKAIDPYTMKILRISFPKIQIITIEQLLRGIKPEMPDTASAFEQAPLTKRAVNKSNYRLDDHQMQF